MAFYGTGCFYENYWQKFHNMRMLEFIDTTYIHPVLMSLNVPLYKHWIHFCLIMIILRFEGIILIIL